MTQVPPNSIPRERRITLICFAVLALTGLALGWNKGQLPRHDPVAAGQSEAAPDLALYRQIISDVRAGRGYYDAAADRIPQFGFPTSSPLNWRLPTYAWLLSRLPNNCWVQAVLLGLAIFGLGLGFVAEARESGVAQAAAMTLLLVGVVRWTFDGQAFLAQEVWAGVLILISIAAQRMAEQRHAVAWHGLAIFTALVALAFRELALPYCCVAAAVSVWQRRWYRAAAWTAGIAAFFAFMAWHVVQVHAQLTGAPAAGGAGLSQWLRLGGLDFVLLTLRMNSLLFAAPACVLWLYLLAALFGLANRRDETSRLCCLAALAYILAFAFVGRPENFYWGLVCAPLLPWGVVHAPRAAVDLWNAAGAGPEAAVPASGRA